jgi:5-formyltetrahydrofolate cyclo-ligase
MVHASPVSAKTLLRLQLRGARRAMATVAPNAAEQAAGLYPLDRGPTLLVAAGYRAQGGEIDPWPLMLRMMQAGASLALPVAVSSDAPLIFRAYQPGDPLAPDACGVAAPLEAAPEVTPDMVITPLLAFDAGGGRMGQGGGHYDRTLAGLRSSGPVFALGLAYAAQEIARIPVEPHDQRLDAILTEKSYRLAQEDF